MPHRRAPARRYVHALGWRVLNRFYDPLIRLTMPERRFKRTLIDDARVAPGFRILDLGCGTGTLLLMLAASTRARSVGIDGDLDILRFACRKATAEGTLLNAAVAHAGALPFREGTFDRVLTTLVLHHLERHAKDAALREAWRVLRPGGELHIADWGRPHTALMRVAALSVTAFDGRSTTRDNVAGQIPAMCQAAGFDDVREQRRWATMFGTLSFVIGKKLGCPGGGQACV